MLKSTHPQSRKLKVKSTLMKKKVQVKNRAPNWTSFKKLSLQTVFFGGSNCLFKDKQGMMAGNVTEFAKKKIETVNNKTNANSILAQVKSEVTKKKYTTAKEAELNKQLHDSVQGLIKLSD